ncbi:hypothetical protein BsIDN1_32060 [Bacillus safensis]|uniref:Sm domain-containing protein n=1 Tax=Bacillus safensis TaxID=561879 RepID=A0A5S9M9M9_BACIA|nr:hypothetical protein BsIDN1_32060 [Bacillus safensis]
MKPINIQEQFLNQIRKDNTFVTVFLLNGFQLRGQVKGFDNFTVLLETEGSSSLFINTPFLHLHLKRM